MNAIKARLLVLLALLFIAAFVHRIRAQDSPAFRVLVFSKTVAFRHASIENGLAAIQALGAENNFAVDHTEDAALFTDENLAQYQVVIFLNTTGDVLDDAQQAAFERFVRAGNGYVGVHAASDTEYNWPWYGELLGSWFANHPAIQEATIQVVDANHASTSHLPTVWVRTDEWYNFRTALPTSINVLLNLDESTYSGGQMGAQHPIAWQHEFDGGRAWYTGMGHTAETYDEPLFRQHLLGGIRWAARQEDAPAATPTPSGTAVTPPATPTSVATPVTSELETFFLPLIYQ
ncbi:MAG: ThuA domain-containing protein [Caldilineaceae bacterium]